MKGSSGIENTNLIDELAKQVVALLVEKKRVLTTVESCTGGWLSKSIVDISGCSSVFHQGIVTYSNEAKQKYVAVSKESLENYGAVSKEVAAEMAFGGVNCTDSNMAISITGIAGPEGGTMEKPIGLVYMGISFEGKVETRAFKFCGSRERVREQAVIKALELLREKLLNM